MRARVRPYFGTYQTATLRVQRVDSPPQTLGGSPLPLADLAYGRRLNVAVRKPFGFGFAYDPDITSPSYDIVVIESRLVFDGVAAWLLWHRDGVPCQVGR